MLNVQVEYLKHLEQVRHNLATEAEDVRSHQEGERISWANLSEVSRHNVVQEQLGFQTLQETTRHNKASERETRRHNVAIEEYNEQQIELGYSTLAETSRHNRATENIQGRQASAALQQAAASARQAEVAAVNADTRKRELEQAKNVAALQSNYNTQYLGYLETASKRSLGATIFSSGAGFFGGLSSSSTMFK